MRRTIVFLAALSFAVPSFAQYAVDSTRTRYITVSGSAQISVVPDQIDIGIGVETFAPTVDAATSQNDTAIRAITAALRKLAIEPEKIRTETMSLDIAYRSSDHPSRGIEGFFAKKTLTVRVPDAATAEKAVTAALANGANRILGIDYNTSQLRKLRDDARVRASQAAREKAQALAAQFGAKIGRPTSIQEGYGTSYGSMRWSRSTFNRNER